MLNDTEQALLREVDDLGALDEDALAALHDRVRRARNKYSKLYRRRASAQVKADASRGRVHETNARAIAKAELFEDALAKVSRRLAAEAAAAAASLKKERLAAAKAVKAGPARPGAKVPRSTGSAKAKAKPSTRTPATEKARASTKATTQRKQAAKDQRTRG